MTNLSPLLNIEEVCNYLKLGKTSVYEMIREGELPYIKIRNRIRVAEDDLLSFVIKHKNGVEESA